MRERKPSNEPPQPRVSDRPASARRRALSTGLAAGVTSLFLPGQWTRPVVQSVLLPAHAQSSPGGCTVELAVGCEGNCETSRVCRLVTFRCEDNCVTFDVEDVECETDPPSPEQILVECGPEADQLVSAVIRFADGSSRLVNSCGDGEPSPVSETAEGVIELECGSFAVSAVLSATAFGENSGSASVSEITVVPA